MIKKLFFGAIIASTILFSGLNSNAQAIESTVKFNKTDVTGFTNNYQGAKDILGEAVENYFKNSFAVKSKSSKGFKLYEGVNWPEVSSEKLDVYYKVSGKKSNSQLEILVSKGYDNFVSSQTDPMTSSNVLIFMNSIKDKMQVVVNNNDVILAEKELKNAEKELEKAKRKASDLRKEKENIEKNIVSQDKTVSDKEKEVSKAKEVLEKAKAK